MERCDVLVVGGGPAGSTCAWKLRQAGLDVVVMDKAAFPRDKVCAGWITPPVVDDLQLDLEDYRRGRTLQPITGFRVGVIGDERDVAVAYDRPVSYGIRRCEFDHYLLARSGATLRLGDGAHSIRRERGLWIVNDSVTAPLLVGAGGHFCPVARMLNPNPPAGPLVVAQEAEFPIASSGLDAPRVQAEMPELYFSRDLQGYGWCFRKQGYLNVGLGRVGGSAFPKALSAFATYLEQRGRLVSGDGSRWRGHAYLLSEPRCRRVRADGAILIGDAAGLAYPQSGEGIRSAVASGLMAAAAMTETDRAAEPGSPDRPSAYERRLDARFRRRSSPPVLSRVVPQSLLAPLGVRLLRVPGFVRQIVLNQWFLSS